MLLKSTIIIIYDNPKQCTIPIHGLIGEKYNIQKKTGDIPHTQLTEPSFFLEENCREVL
jgi:hypothetical protein